MMKIATYDFGGTAVKYALFCDSQLSQVSQFPTPDSFEEMKEKMRTVLQHFNCRIDGVAVSSPGAVNIEKRRIDGVSAIPYLHHRPIFDELAAYLQVPVTIENDANCAGICEMKIGAGQGFSHAAFIVLGTGIGGSIFINGRLYKGAHLFGGEFGLLKKAKNEIFSSNSTAVKAALRYSKLTNSVIDGYKLFELSDKGDSLARALLNDMYQSVAELLYTIQVSLDPEVIILGGGISARTELLQEVTRRLKELLREENVVGIMPVMKCCKYRNNANLLGAAFNYLMYNKCT